MLSLYQDNFVHVLRHLHADDLEQLVQVNSRRISSMLIQALTEVQGYRPWMKFCPRLRKVEAFDGTRYQHGIVCEY